MWEWGQLDPFGEHLVTQSGKLRVLDQLVPKLAAQQSRLLIFSQMTRMLDILEDFCTMRGLSFCRIDGSTSAEDRDQQIADFNAPVRMANRCGCRRRHRRFLSLLCLLASDGMAKATDPFINGLVTQ